MTYLHPQPVGAFFAQPETFRTQIALLSAVAQGIRRSKMPAFISTGEARNLVDNALQAYMSFSSTVVRLLKDPTNVFVQSQIHMAHSDAEGVFARDLRPLVSEVAAARRAGAASFPTAGLKRVLPRLADAVRRGYETLHELEKIKPFLIRNMPATLAFFGKIGQGVEAVSELTDQALTAASNALADMASSFLKWTLITTALVGAAWLYTKR